MIAYIKGIVQFKEERSLVVMAGNIGYRIFLTQKDLTAVSSGQAVEYFLYHAISETQQTLYGFADKEYLQLFELLLTLDGIGPKFAQSILNKVTAEDLQKAVDAGDPNMLHKFSGLGKKTAERVIVGLRGKTLSHSRSQGVESVVADVDILEALEQLGYSALEARDAVRSLSSDLITPEARIAEALKFLHKK